MRKQGEKNLNWVKEGAEILALITDLILFFIFKHQMHQHSQKKYQQQYHFKSSVHQQKNVQPLGALMTSKHEHEEQGNPQLQYELLYNSVSYPSQASFDDLGKMKDVLLDLIDEFKIGKKRVVIDGDRKDEYEKRLLLLEHQLNGLMKQRIMFEAPDREGGTRKLDYALLLNEKQNQIVQLEKKINNLEERMRRASQRELQLENQITFLQSKLKAKNSVIEVKQRQLSEQTAYSQMMSEILTNVKSTVSSNHELSRLILQSVPTLQRNQIKSMSSRIATNVRGGDFSSNEMMKLVRGLDGLSGKKASREELEGFVEGWILGLPEDSSLKKKILEGEVRLKNQERVKIADEKLKFVGEIYKKQIQSLRRSNPSFDIAVDENIFGMLRDSSSRVSINSSGIIEIEKNIVKTVEVPVQDTKTKQLIYQLATQMKRLYTKYPKLYSEIDPRLAQYFSQELIDIISVDQVDRLVSIVKYEPQVVRVENVYAYSSEKNRKIEFHLRVLLKALLTEMEKMIARTGIVPEIDEGVIGLIKQQIMDIVDVDDILKVYRTVPKIVEVEKVIEKVVQKIVEVPKLVATENRVQVPVQVKKVEVVQNVRNVPVEVPRVETIFVQKLVEVPKFVEKIVEVPQIIENPVEVIKQVPKIVEVEKVVQRIVQVEKIKEVVEQVIVKVPEVEQVIVQIQKIVPTEKIIEVLKPVQVVVQRVQEVVRQVPKVVQVEKIKEVIVEKPVYYPAPQIEHEVIVKQVPVDRIIEKIVPVVKVEDRIIQVPKIIQKIVEVRDIIKEPIQVQVIRDRPIFKETVKVVQVTVEKPFVERIEVEKPVDRFIEVPVIHEIVKVERQIVKEPVIERVQSIIHKEIEIQKPVVLYQDRIVEVQKIVNNFISQPQVINVVEEKIVPLQTVIKEPIAVPTIIEKIIEKLVEVPKVIEVEKIVEKIVPVPRVVEKVVEVQKIVQKIVNKIIIEEKIKEIQKLIEVPAIQEKIIEVQVPRNIYIENQVPVEVKQEFLVRDQVRIQNTQIHEIEQPPRVVVETREVPKELMVEKIIPLSIPETNLVYLDKQIVVPLEIEIPVDVEREKFVPIEHVREQIVEIDREREKIIPVSVEPDPNIIEVERYEERPYIEEKVKVVVEEKPYFETVIKEVKTYEDKIVPVTTEVERLLKVTEMCDRIVDRVVESPKIYEVERKVQKMVDKPRIVQVEKIVPHIINVNSYIETIAQKIIDIPVLLERLKEIDRIEEKVVQVQSTNTEVKEVDRVIERAVIQEKIQQAVDRIHVTEEILKVADKMIYKQSDPVIISQDKVMQVPFVVQKIVQKIVVMPQIVEVLKYVHEVTEQGNLGVAVSGEVGEKEVQYKALAGNVRGQLTKLLVQLKQMWSVHPELRGQIQIIQRFLAEFEKLILYPRIHEIIREKQVEKQVEKRKIVPVPVGSNEHDLRMELSKAILIQKLILQLKRLKEENPQIKFNLDEDIKLIFGSELKTSSNLVGADFNRLITDYSSSIQSKFKSMGGWSMDHQLMLNSFLEERFLMANILRTANSDLNKTKAISEKRLETMRKYKFERDQMEKAFNMLNSFLPTVLESGRRSRSVDEEMVRKADQWMAGFSNILVSSTIKGGQPTRNLQKLEQSRYSSIVREKQEQILRLKAQMREMMKGKHNVGETQIVYKEIIKEADNSGYIARIRELQARIRELEAKIRQLERTSSSGIKTTSDRGSIEKIMMLEKEIEKLRIIERDHQSSESQIRRLNLEITNLRKRLAGLKDSRTVGSPEFDSERHKSQSSSSSSYGVNYMDYANIDENTKGAVGQIEGAHHVYKSTYAYGGGDREGGFTSLTHSKAEGGGVGGNQKYQTSYRHEYSGSGVGGTGGIEGASYRTMQYAREGGGGGIERSSGMRMGGIYESQVYGQDSRSSEMYRTSSKEIIKRTSYETEGKRYEREQ